MRQVLYSLVLASSFPRLFVPDARNDYEWLIDKR